MEQSPAFGEADLTNCERELIHLAASVQPHGVLLTLSGDELRVVQTSANLTRLLGRAPESVLGSTLDVLGDDLVDVVRAASPRADELAPLSFHLDVRGDVVAFEGTVHRSGRWTILEFEPKDREHAVVEPLSVPEDILVESIRLGVERISSATSLQSLADATVSIVREVTGYDRVMLYRFDPDGHGKVIGEERDPRLDSFLGHQYPASDIPQRARQLYLRNRLRLLADVYYEPSPLVPRMPPGESADLDMSMCYLRSMSPLHLQYLQNMGVTATLVASIVRDGLWGLIACHHYSPRNLVASVRSAVDLIAEVVATRLSAIESYARARVAIQVRRLEQRLVEATSTDGDWRLALFRNPKTLLQPVDATGAAISYDDEILTTGEVPSTPELRALLEWIETRTVDGLFSCSSISRENPELRPLTPTASGVLAVELSSARPSFLLWFRKEQLHSVTWAGDPSKPMIGDDPMDLSPRRSFAAWSELVRGTAVLWSPSEIALARAFGASLVQIIAQVDAVRYLIAERQLELARSRVTYAKGALLIADADLDIRYATDAFYALTGGDVPQKIIDLLREVRRSGHGWRGRIEIARRGAAPIPVAVRAEVVPAREGGPIGFFVVCEDLTESQRGDAARRELEASLEEPLEWSADAVVSAIRANASLAAMDIADGHVRLSAANAMVEVEQSTRRATALYDRIRSLLRR